MRRGWHGGAGCARAADRPRHKRLVPSGGERTGRRARDPDPGTGPAALSMPRMPTDRAFSRRAGFQAYLIAAFSLVYAVVFLGFVRNHPENIQAAALAWALIAGAGLSATIATTSAAARVGGDARWWLTALGVGYGLLSAAHGTFAAIAVEQGIAATDLSPTDPRGLATFGLAGLWALTLGLETVAGNGALPRNLGWLAIVGGLDLIVLFIATVAASENLILVSGGLASVILVPAFWIWTGRVLRG